MRSPSNASPTKPASTKKNCPALTGVENHSPECTHTATTPPAISIPTLSHRFCTAIVFPIRVGSVSACNAAFNGIRNKPAATPAATSNAITHGNHVIPPATWLARRPGTTSTKPTPTNVATNNTP